MNQINLKQISVMTVVLMSMAILSGCGSEGSSEKKKKETSEIVSESTGSVSDVSDSIIEDPSVGDDSSVTDNEVTAVSESIPDVLDSLNISANDSFAADSITESTNGVYAPAIYGQWYCEREDMLLNIRSDRTVFITEHGESYEFNWEVTDHAVIEGVETGIPEGYDGIFIYYLSTGGIKPWAYRLGENETLILAQIHAQGVDEPDEIVLDSDETYYRQYDIFAE